MIKSSISPEIQKSELLYNDYSSIRPDTIWNTPCMKNESKTEVNSLKEYVEPDKTDIPSKKMRHISLHLMRNINRLTHKHCVHIDETSQSDSRSRTKGSQLTCDSATIESTSKTTIPTSKNSQKSSSARQRAGSSKSVKTVNRKDPVALYHYYQSEWKKVKFPGEEEHALLRRTIRNKLSDKHFKKT